ncbi:ATP-binding protein [Nonomuraea rhizosphaerae]|uniref:ATP-binding protein n=1 Tax=Nonomuraea rhizosphaerae TaxID=2665663 RepID=UPI001C5F5564|nr:LuxR C-terminal-related transcriptional regulator [Nonomuraea rhizosphaerae]
MAWRATLPTATTSFVGRRQEVADVRRMLQRSRLVTITGIAGVGKTRVAIRAAQLMRRAFTDGIWFVELSGHTDPDSLEQVIAHALDVTGDLAAHLAQRRLLLVLDTCEHLADACSALVQYLLRAAPGLHVLATSRQALRAPGEHALIVRPLQVPGTEGGADQDVAHVESVALFLDRVAGVDPEFEITEDNAAAVAELCRRLEGIPLAVELAAVRAGRLPVDELLALMDAHGPLAHADAGVRRGRHSTMQAAIAWSHELCSAEERLLWERLTVFAGTFDLTVAEIVCSGQALPATRVYPTLAGLVEKSIVIRERDERHTVYRLPDSVREFAAARLEGTGEPERLRTRHREHYYAVALAFGADRPGRDRVEDVVRLRADWANLRAALESYAADPQAREHGLEMGLWLGYLWMFGGMARYGRRYLERLLPATRCPDAVRRDALLQLAHLAAGRGDLPEARAALEQAEPFGGPAVVKMRGTVSFCEGDLEAAERHLTEAIAGLTGGLPLTNATVELGLTLMLAGRTAEADEALTRARALCQAEGDGGTAAWAELALALVRRLGGQYAEAEPLARAALRTQASLNVTFARAFCVEVLGWLAADQDMPARAVRLLSAAHRLWGYEVNPLFGSPVFAAERRRYDRELRESLGQQYGRSVVEGRAMSAEEAIADALSTGDVPVAESVPFWAPLTPREADVAELVADGLTNRLIAQRLVVARRTVDTHVENILAKLGFSGRGQVAAWVTKRRQQAP